jgi:ionotropic glutamate receptor NMDA 1/ionotropic glutamate receptor
MQDVMCFKTGFGRISKPLKRLRSRFRSKYLSEYPEEEEEYCNPSILALRAYDATWAIAEAIKKSAGEMSPTELFKGILSRKFKGLSGAIRFKSNVV